MFSSRSLPHVRLLDAQRTLNWHLVEVWSPDVFLEIYCKGELKKKGESKKNPERFDLEQNNSDTQINLLVFKK